MIFLVKFQTTAWTGTKQSSQSTPHSCFQRELMWNCPRSKGSGAPSLQAVTEIHKPFWVMHSLSSTSRKWINQSFISLLDTGFIVSPVLLTSCSAQRCPTDGDPGGYFWREQQFHEGAAIPWRSVPVYAGRAGHSRPDLCGRAIPPPLPTLLTWAQPSPKASGMQMLQMHFPQGTPSALGCIFS